MKLILNEFSCKDKSVELFLKNQSIEFDKRNIARTYLIVKYSETAQHGIIIIAYFTIALKNLEFGETLSKNKIKQIDGFSKNAKSVSSILIGQLGKNDCYAKQITGKEILELATSFSYQIHDIIGCRILLIECLPIDKIVNFYKQNDFVLLQKSGEFMQMIKFL